MTRAVLVGHSTADWRLYRQPQWMAEVRRNPEASTLPKRYFDLEEDAYRQTLDRWEATGASTSAEKAVEILAQHAAIEIRRA